jgi:hypothetical protein
MENNETVKSKILICFHKPYPVSNAEIYLPVQGGKANSELNLGFVGDNTGDNISNKNASYSELSVMYWAWKNLKQIYPNIKYVGFYHYRRYIALDKTGKSMSFLNLPDMFGYEDIIEHELEQNDFILQKPIEFRYTIKTQYELYHNYKDWIGLKKLVIEMFPEYKKSFEKILEEENMFIANNLFVTRWEKFAEYCEWLFSILFEMEKRISIENYDPYQKRMVAFMSERLFTLYVFHNKFKVCYKPIYFIEEKIFEEKIFEGKTQKLKGIIKKYIKFLIPHGIILWLRNKVAGKKIKSAPHTHYKK